MAKTRAIYLRLRTAVPMYRFLPPKIYNNPTMNFAVVIDHEVLNPSQPNFSSTTTGPH